MRYYEPVWRKLKSNGKASITANVALHPRIVKAVTKEKYNDIAYKIEIAPYHSVLIHRSEGAILHFTLYKRRNLATIQASEL